MRISDWSSDVCSSDLLIVRALPIEEDADDVRRQRRDQREGRRHMHIEPDFEQRPDAKMLAQPGQRGFLLLEQSYDLFARFGIAAARQGDRKSTRLNSSH